MLGAASAREGLETAAVTELLDDDAFSAAFDSFVTPKTETEPEKIEPEAKAEPEAKVEPEMKVEPEAKVEPEVKVEAPAPAVTAKEIGLAVAEALKVKEPEKVAEPEVESPEVASALKDLQENWPTHGVAVNALLERQKKELKAEFAEILKPLQAQIAPLAEATAISTQAQFNAALKAEHADVFDILPAVEEWITKQPAYLQPAYNAVLDKGTVTEVSKFLTDYKAMTSKVEPAAAPDPAKLAAEAAAAAKLKKMETPTTTRTSVTAEPDPTDFDSAFEAGAKLAMSM